MAQLNEREKQKLLTILDKDPSAITPADAEYLRARESYVGKRSQQKFASVFAKQKKSDKGEE